MRCRAHRWRLLARRLDEEGAVPPGLENEEGPVERQREHEKLTDCSTVSVPSPVEVVKFGRTSGITVSGMITAR